jgi:hypothetical protein
VDAAHTAAITGSHAAATRSVAGILRKGRIGENHPKYGNGCNKKISSLFAGRWQDVSVPANAPPFKHTKPCRQPADFRNQTPDTIMNTINRMNKCSQGPRLAGLLTIGISLGLGAPATVLAQSPSPVPAGEQLPGDYDAALKDLQAQLAAAVPRLSEPKKATFQAAREAVMKAQADVAAAQAPFDKIEGAEGLVGHRKGKWIGGAEKGIAAAEAALKKATTDAEREAAKKDLAHWQADLEAGRKALVVSLAALDAAKADEAKYQQAKQAAQAAQDAAVAKELQSAKDLLADAMPFLSSDKLDAQLVRCAVLANATPKGLTEFARQGKEQEALVAKHLADTALVKAMLVAGGAKDGKYGAAMQIYASIQKASPRAKEGIFQRLAVATSIEHAEPVKQVNPVAAANAPAFVDPVKRYLHFEKAYLGGELDPAFKDLSAWELRNVINGNEPDETLVWGRAMLRNYRPDHILNMDYGWRYSGAVTTDVKYGSEDVKFDRPELQDYQNIIMNGGVCGRRAFFGRFILRCFGIPTVARPQVGHGALARWTPDGWIVNLGAGWGSRESNGVMQMTDADFVLETQVRKDPAGHERALRAQWVGDALGEPKYVSMQPGSGGLWNVLSQFQKKLIVAETKAVTLAARGTELGEANLSAETMASALVKAEVSKDDMKIATSPEGVITIPAAACEGGNQLVKSFLGGQQMICALPFNFDVNVPRAGKYQLSARIVTVRDTTPLLLTLNKAMEGIGMPIPYTLGAWQQTPPVTVELKQGGNTLAFTNQTRAFALKDLTLTLAK